MPESVIPHRVHLVRAKGWRLPANTITVARPTVWGNPFRKLKAQERSGASLCLFEATAKGRWDPSLIPPTPPAWPHDGLYRYYVEWRTRVTDRFGVPVLDAIQTQLGGHHLACWCPLDQPCHADVLLRLANLLNENGSYDTARK